MPIVSSLAREPRHVEASKEIQAICLIFTVFHHQSFMQWVGGAHQRMLAI